MLVLKLKNVFSFKPNLKLVVWSPLEWIGSIENGNESFRKFENSPVHLTRASPDPSGANSNLNFNFNLNFNSTAPSKAETEVEGL